MAREIQKGDDTILAPNLEDMDDLLDWIVEQGYEKKDGIDLVLSSHIVVVHPYMPDSPGYTGRVMVVLWPGGAELVESFGWKKEGEKEVLFSFKSE